MRVIVETDVPDGCTMSVDQEIQRPPSLLISMRPPWPAPTSNKWHGLPWHRLAEAILLLLARGVRGMRDGKRSDMAGDK